MKPISRLIGEGAPYYRVALPSGRATVIRSWRRSRSLDLVAPCSAFDEQARAIVGRLKANAERAQVATIDEAGEIASVAVALSREFAALAEASSGHAIGAVWSDPGLSLEAWDDPAPRSPMDRGQAIVAELDEAGWSSADIMALARAARLVLAMSGDAGTQAALDRLQAAPPAEPDAPPPEQADADAAASAEARVSLDASEIAGFSAAPKV